MLEFFSKLFQADFMPHGHCYFWRPEIVWLHVLSDGLIALAYYFIPFTLVYIVKRRRDLVYHWMFLLFGLFILSCGTTHLMAIWTLWEPVYRLDGVIKAITALSSVPTALLLLKLTPQIVHLPSPEMLRREIAERKAAEEQVRVLNRELEARVAERTHELEEANRQLRLAFERLSESEARLNAILNHAPAAVYLKDMEGRITFANRGFAAATGIEPEFAVGKTDHDLFSRTLAANLREHDRAVLEAGHALEFEETITAGGRNATFMSVKFPISGSDGKAYALCGISMDITERKRAQQARERYTRELEDFAHVASHDLQEPLRTITSYTQLLERRYRGRLDGEADDFIGFIVGGARRMGEIISGLLDYSRVVNRAAEEPGEADMESALTRALESLRGSIGESGAQIARDPLPRVQGNAQRLERVLQNLIGNAIKYRDPSRPPEVRVSAVCSEGWCTFSVADNGIGIGATFHDRIFGLFKRLHGQEYPGTGIGLTIAKKIIEAEGGSIWLESEPGVGSTFYFKLRQAATPAPSGSRRDE